MKIEWATICREIQPRDGTVDLLDALSDTFEMTVALPTEVTAEVALIIQAETSEISQGGTVTVAYVVQGPNQQIVTRGRVDFIYPAPDMTLVPSLTETRAAFPVPVPFPATEYGAYGIGVTIGEGPAWLLTCYVVSQ
jgi:hypothetical protein